MKKPQVVVHQNPDNVIEKFVLAKAITDISQAMTRLVASGLNERAIVCLVHEASGVGKQDIRAVLASLRTLAKEFCA